MVCFAKLRVLHIVLGGLLVFNRKAFSWLVGCSAMKDFVAFAQQRRSYRRFNSKQVPLELVADCLLAASFAPSAGDLQPWEFVIITEPESLRGVVRACEGQDWLAQAPVVVAVLGDGARAETFHGELGVRWCRDSCVAATQNLLLAAHERGLAGCWVSAFDEDLLLESLDCPGSSLPVALVALGFSDELLIEKAVTPLEQLCHFDSYGRRRRDVDEDIKDYGDVFRKRKKELSERLSSSREESGDSDSSFASRMKNLFGFSKK